MKDKVVFVSGGARGVGAHIVRGVLEAGGSVFCGSRRGAAPSDLPSHATKRLAASRLDVTDYASCALAMKQCVEEFGRVDILVNNASGYFGGEVIGRYAPDDIKAELEATLLGAIYLTNAFMDIADRADARQHVIFMSSISAVPREPGNGRHCVYAAAKAGVIRFAQAIQETTSGTNTSAHVLIPGNIRGENLGEDQAISFQDLYRALQFVTDASDNLQVDQLVLAPFQHGGAHTP